MHHFNGLSLNNNKEAKVITSSASSTNYSSINTYGQYGNMNQKKNTMIKGKLNTEFIINNRPHTSGPKDNKTYKPQNLMVPNNPSTTSNVAANRKPTGNVNMHYNNNYLSGSLKRAPTPMNHSNNEKNNRLYQSQKIRPAKYRPPSPALSYKPPLGFESINNKTGMAFKKNNKYPY